MFAHLALRRVGPWAAATLRLPRLGPLARLAPRGWSPRSEKEAPTRRQVPASLAHLPRHLLRDIGLDPAYAEAEVMLDGGRPLEWSAGDWSVGALDDRRRLLATRAGRRSR